MPKISERNPVHGLIDYSNFVLLIFETQFTNPDFISPNPIYQPFSIFQFANTDSDSFFTFPVEDTSSLQQFANPYEDDHEDNVSLALLFSQLFRKE